MSWSPIPILVLNATFRLASGHYRSPSVTSCCGIVRRACPSPLRQISVSRHCVLLSDDQVIAIAARISQPMASFSMRKLSMLHQQRLQFKIDLTCRLPQASLPKRPTLPTSRRWRIMVDDHHGPKDSPCGFQHPRFVGSRPPR